MAQKLGLSEAEVAAITEAATTRHKMKVVGLHREGPDTIAVYMAESDGDMGGLIFYFKRSDASWVEDTNVFAPWDRT